jgi:LPS-assembly lipoprotein
MMRGLLLLLFGFLPGCGLQPIYAGGSDSAAAQVLAATSVPLIPDRAGFLVRQALLDRLVRGEEAGARYRLDIEVDDNITGLGIRGDEAIARERRTLRARWQLVDTASGVTLIDATERADAGIDVVGSEYAVVAAEDDALERLADELADQIAARIAGFAVSERR